MISIREIDRAVLRVRDMDAMRRFYCEVLGAAHVAWRPEFGMSHLKAGASMIGRRNRRPGQGARSLERQAPARAAEPLRRF